MPWKRKSVFLSLLFDFFVFFFFFGLKAFQEPFFLFLHVKQEATSCRVEELFVFENGNYTISIYVFIARCIIYLYG